MQPHSPVAEARVEDLLGQLLVDLLDELPLHIEEVAGCGKIRKPAEGLLEVQRGIERVDVPELDLHRQPVLGGDLLAPGDSTRAHVIADDAAGVLDLATFPHPAQGALALDQIL